MPAPARCLYCILYAVHPRHPQFDKAVELQSLTLEMPVKEAVVRKAAVDRKRLADEMIGNEVGVILLPLCLSIFSRALFLYHWDLLP